MIQRPLKYELKEIPNAKEGTCSVQRLEVWLGLTPVSSKQLPGKKRQNTSQMHEHLQITAPATPNSVGSD